MTALLAALGAACALGDLSGLAAATRPAVALLTIRDSSGQQVGAGTGFFVAREGRLLTNAHVIAQASSVDVTLADRRVLSAAGVLALDEAHDLALLAVEGSSFAHLRLGASAGLRQGDEVVVIGSPLGLAGTLSAGIVSALRAEGLPETPLARGGGAAGPLVQISAAISPGSSGSPVLTMDGAVIGVAVSTFLGGQNLNFAVPAEAAAALLAAVDPATPPRPFARSRLINLAYSAAFFGALGLAWLAGRLALKRRRRTRYQATASS